MIRAILLALMLGAGFAVVGPAVARRVSPAGATWLLSTGSALVALSTTAVLALLVLPVVAEEDEIAEAGGWSIAVLRHHDPVSRALAGVCAVTLTFAFIRLARTATAKARALVAAYRTSTLLGERVGQLVVLPAAGSEAYAVPGHPGRIVVTQGLLRQLPADERAAVLAHERSHLAHGHHWHLALAAMAAALHPLLRRIPPALAFATERWADEDAAREVDRSVAAAALAHAAALDAVAPAGPALAVAHVGVADRVQALLAAPPRRRPFLVGSAALLVACAVASSLVASYRTAEVFETAIHAAHHVVLVGTATTHR